jgi:hypothetical protein
MQAYLITPSGEAIPIPALPGTRDEAVALISRHAYRPLAAGPFRIVKIEEFDVSPDESCEVEAFAVGFRNYGGGAWGLVEASVEAIQMPSDFSPTTDDVALWFKALRDCWQISPSDFTYTLEPVDDFHVLQFFEGQRLLTSVTWNAPDVHITYLMPNTLETPQHLCGDGLLDNVELLYEALRGLNFFSLRK